jgi:hypothetical protein
MGTPQPAKSATRIKSRTLNEQHRSGRNLQQGMTIGIHHDRDMRQVAWLPGMLTRPFKGRPPGCAINRRE